MSLQIKDLKPSFPKDIQDFLNENQIEISINDLTVYEIQDNIVITAVITNDEGVDIQWEPIPETEDFAIWGDLID